MKIESTLQFERIDRADVPELTAVMTRAFDDDSQKHLGKERGGPPGYDDGAFFEKWLFGYEQTDGYKALLDEAAPARGVGLCPLGTDCVGIFPRQGECNHTASVSRVTFYPSRLAFHNDGHPR